MPTYLLMSKNPAEDTLEPDDADDAPPDTLAGDYPAIAYPGDSRASFPAASTEPLIHAQVHTV
jgi:hypothetical protein